MVISDYSRFRAFFMFSQSYVSFLLKLFGYLLLFGMTCFLVVVVVVVVVVFFTSLLPFTGIQEAGESTSLLLSILHFFIKILSVLHMYPMTFSAESLSRHKYMYLCKLNYHHHNIFSSIMKISYYPARAVQAW